MDGYSDPRCETSDSADVIVMLVGDDNRVDILGRQSDSREAQPRLGEGETAVEHYASSAAFDDKRIAATAAAEGGEAHGASTLLDLRPRDSCRDRAQRRKRPVRVRWRQSAANQARNGLDAVVRERG
jgi:hypothetical protein